MDDEAILAGLDGEPEAFAVFYRRHVAALCEHFASRTRDPRLAADLCAETFATALDDAHRFDPARGLAVDWLYRIAWRLLNEAGRRGAVEGRARRRLGLAALEPGDSFVEALEEELVEAARFRARRRRDRLALRLVRHRALAVIAALTLAAVVGALAVRRGSSDRATSERSVTEQASFVVPLAPMLSTAACRGRDARGEAAAEAAAALSVTDGVLRTGVRVVSPLGVSDDADCVPGEGPGACLVVEDRSSYRCFGLADVRAGRALARTAEGLIVGVVPDDVDRVTLTAHGRTAGAVVVDNVYEARLDVPSGTPVRVALDHLWDDVCQREVAPGLLASVATLRRKPDDRLPVPQAVRRALESGSEYRFDGGLLRGARHWGGDGGVEFWAVPVAARGSEWCAPANGVCVVAVPPDPPADAACSVHRYRNPEFWRVTPLPAGNAAIFGVVADDVIGARVTVGTLAAQVDARENLIGGVLPFPYQDGLRVDLIRRTAP